MAHTAGTAGWYKSALRYEITVVEVEIDGREFEVVVDVDDNSVAGVALCRGRNARRIRPVGEFARRLREEALEVLES